MSQEMFQVKINSTGQLIDVEPDQSIAHALAANRIYLLTSCEQGICGTCLTGVVDGIPEHHDSFLTDEERAANDQCLPCCARSKTPVLVLDL